MCALRFPSCLPAEITVGKVRPWESNCGGEKEREGEGGVEERCNERIRKDVAYEGSRRSRAGRSSIRRVNEDLAHSKEVKLDPAQLSSKATPTTPSFRTDPTH
ncbi:hypothetical protein JZ751_021083 [Albula glossodonta]|uniref:Uncharacterized protein n=1 Tax=Albula glossodonta TaxID=121402 RepID=A0A8T2PK49_9TELE|nr:hypothetical protein JZ751_021083 [Albula glossodonta]